jgi:putative phosphoribosyl transferase
MQRDVFDEALDQSIRIPPFQLAGRLSIPRGAQAVILFAHGSGSSHQSPRNKWAAEVLRRRGLGTLLFDLLTPEEAADRRNVFDIGLLAERLELTTRWLDEVREAAPHRIGYFGASTGAAAALVAAARQEREIGAIVSRGGRPDLAGPALFEVESPTLLIVGGYDEVVLGLNQAALAKLRCHKKLEIVPGATHLFEEPGTLERAIELAADWFSKHLLLEENPRCS